MPNVPTTQTAQQWAKTLNIKNAKVIQISGFSKVNEFEIHTEPEEAAGQLIGEAKP